MSSSHHKKSDITLVIRIPSDFSGSPELVSQILEALHPTLGHSLFSLDFHVINRKLFFSVQVSAAEKSILENQLYTTFQNIEIDEVRHPLQYNHKNSARASVFMKEKDFFPIQTYHK